MPDIVESPQPSEEAVQNLHRGSDPQNIQESEPQPAPARELPAKYRGKEIEDIIAMHQEAEKLIGRQGQEVKQVRELADQLLKRDLLDRKAETPKEPEEIDFFTDPKKAVERAVSNHPAVREAEEKLKSLQRDTAYEKLMSKHSDMREILQDDQFAEFVRSSRIRQELFHRADTAYDYEAADELMTSYKLQKDREKSIVEEGVKEVKEKAATNLKKSTVSSGTSNPTSGKRIYNRAELLEWRLRNPSKYAAIADDITLAYLEDRVK